MQPTEKSKSEIIRGEISFIDGLIRQLNQRRQLLEQQYAQEVSLPVGRTRVLSVSADDYMKKLVEDFQREGIQAP